MKTNALRESRFFINSKINPQIAKGVSRGDLKRNLQGLKRSGGLSLRRSLNSIKNMYIYIAWCLTHPSNPKKFREIRCENKKCGSYENLEFHHKKYEPEERVYLKDIRIFCCKCHRNSKPAKNKRSQLRTIFKNGKRYCETDKFKFEY